ncbi:MAG: hypothetical protein A2Y40_09415 [Candidatus Margulisbacteria bacterium GWF2_35_9]|nr:MAG: hypothetical protein A2Y40_09415 [Candidatus Margulisbacteria bacterium GWF2_35_9]
MTERNKTHPHKTSWENSAQKYHKIVGEDGHYYHKEVILPKTLNMLHLENTSSVLDLGCGQGVFARAIPKESAYYGVDISSTLISKAKELTPNKHSFFKIQDISKAFTLPKTDFTHCVIILALQNVESVDAVFSNAFNHLDTGGKFLIVINHPAFRIPRQSSWGIDEKNKMQYRRVNNYISPLKIPIDMAPGSADNKKLTWSFHYPLSYYANALRSHGFIIETIDEWVSNKESSGKHAKMENRSRDEFPLFMAILAEKK